MGQRDEKLRKREERHEEISSQVQVTLQQYRKVVGLQASTSEEALQNLQAALHKNCTYHLCWNLLLVGPLLQLRLPHLRPSLAPMLALCRLARTRIRSDSMLESNGGN